MEMFGVSVYLSKPVNTADIISLLERLEPNFISAQMLIQLDATESIFYPYQLEIDGLKRIANRWQAIYSVIQTLSITHQLRAAVEYQHPSFPADPYYSLVFEEGNIALGDDSHWEEAGNIAIVELPFDAFSQSLKPN
jgi:YesN/AraC family two-component response regulator